MAEITKVTTPMVPKENLGNKYKPITDQAFELTDPAKVHQANQEGKPAERQTETGTNLRGNLGRAALLPILKNTSEILQTFKKIGFLIETGVSASDALSDSQVKELLKSLFVSPDALMGALLEQDQSAVLFKGGVFDILRDILRRFEGSPKIRDAIANLLKAFDHNVNSQNSVKTILYSCSNLLDYMFTKDRSQFVDYLSGLAAMLLPEEEAAKIMAQINPGQPAAEQKPSAAPAQAASDSPKNADQQNVQQGQTGTAAGEAAPEAMKNAQSGSAQAAPETAEGRQAGSTQTAPEAPEGGQAGPTQAAPETPEGKQAGSTQAAPEAPEGKQAGSTQTAPETPEGKQAGSTQAAPEAPEGKQAGSTQTAPQTTEGGQAGSTQTAPEAAEGRQAGSAQTAPETAGGTQADSTQTAQETARLSQRETAQLLKNNLLPLLGEIVTKYHQNEHIRDVVMVVVHNIVRVDQGTPESLKEAVDKLLSELKQIAKLPENFEKNLLESVRISAEQAKNTPNTVVEKLSDIISETLKSPEANPAILRQAENMLISMLQNQSSVMDVLHFMLPIEMPQGQVFAELYVDPETDERAGKYQGKSRKIFLSVESDTYGSFELSFLETNEHVDFSMWCPEDLVKPLSGLKRHFANIMQLHGYTMNNFNIDKMQGQHSVAEVFPRLLNKRVGIDVQI